MRQWVYVESINTQIQRNNDVIFRKFNDTKIQVSDFLKKFQTNFKLDYEFDKKPKEVEIFEVNPKLTVNHEKIVNYICYSYFKDLEGKKKKRSAIINEIDDLRKYLDGKQNSKINFLVLSLFERDITISKFFSELGSIHSEEGEEKAKVGIPVSVGIRYLFIMMINFTEIREIQENGKMLASIISDLLESKKFYLKIFSLEIMYKLRKKKESQIDKQIVFYILKITDMLYIRKKRDIIFLMRMLKFTKKDFNYLQDALFWSDYYRNSNYFFEKNTSILQNIRKTYKTGTMEDTVKIIMDKYKKKDLPKILIRASSLNDMIRFMVMLGIDVTILNGICFDLTKKYNIENILVKNIVLEVEEKFWFTNFSFEKISIKSLKIDKTSLEFLWPRVCGFLEENDMRELMFTSKGMSEKIKKIFCKKILIEKENINPELRQKLWLSIIPEVSFFLKNNF